MKKIVQLAVFLAVIGGLSGLCLSLVNSVTKPLIDERATAKAKEYLESIFPDSDNYELADENGNGSAIQEVYVAKSGSNVDGYAYMLSVTGYGGEISYMIGISDGEYVGYEIISASEETPGIGSKIEEDDFRSQFDHTSIDSNVDAISGATISSSAVINGASEAVEDFNDNYK